MFSITEKTKYNKKVIIWFAEDRKPDIEKKFDIVEYIQIDKPFCTPTRESKTLINDLTLDENDNWARFVKNTKYEINRAMRDGYVALQYSKEELLNEKTLLEISEYYVEFLKSKNLFTSTVNYYYNNLHKYAINGNLCITKALKNDMPLVYHYYIYDNDTTRLLYSASQFRKIENASEKQIAGMANRFLHFKDMNYFKNLGIKKYDWGGYSSDPALEGINKFKAGFGGELKNTYYITLNKSIKAKLIFKISKIIANKATGGNK